MYHFVRLSVLPVALLLATFCKAQSQASTNPGSQIQNPYSVGRVGNPADIQTPTEMGLVLMGGSTDVDEAMRWMIERSGGGDFVIIRASGGAGYNDYLYKMGGLNSVETLLINSPEAANSQVVAETLKNAEALFIAGGDQSVYLSLWEGTPVEEALKYLIHEKKIPLGGTSAGCAIMGEYVYTGEQGSIVSNEALQNPFDPRMTIRRSNLINHPLLENTITDQHFTQRNREGRLVGFMARLKEFSDIKPLKAIAVDEKTAVVIDKNGMARVFGQSAAYFLLEKDPESQPEKIQPGEPLTWNLHQQALRYKTVTQEQNLSFDLTNWALDWDGFWYVDEGVLKRN
jgi:cyanophycinase